MDSPGRDDDHAERQEELAARERLERLLHRVHAAGHVEQLLDLFAGEDDDAIGKSEPTSSRSAAESDSDSASRTVSRCSGRRGPTTTEPPAPSAQASASAAVLTPRSAAARASRSSPS